MGPLKLLKLYRLIVSLSVLLRKIQEGEINHGPALGQVRHTLTTLGGILISQGLISESLLSTIMGAVPVIFGMAWSFIAKKEVK